MNLRLDALVLDPRCQPRTEILSRLVDEYAEDRKAGSEFPPVTVFSDGEVYWLADGWHRVYAARKLKRASVEADVREGGVREAILYAMGANAHHGARRTNEDKRRAVKVLLADTVWMKWTDNKIAKQCGVTHPFVGSIRASLVTVTSEPATERTYTTKHGTVATMQTANIGGNGKAAELIAPALVLTPTGLPVTRSQFNRTNDNIGWALWSWNPVTGCKHGCEYCYARDIAMRFSGTFEPAFHEDRIEAPGQTNPIMDSPAGRRVFVCSMADLFGAWVPNEWIHRVMEQVQKNPQWTFLFLTKNPRRYESILFPDNAWIGATVDGQKRVAATEKAMAKAQASVKFVSCEPLLGPVTFSQPDLFDWFLIGAKSEGATKVQPASAWTVALMAQAHAAGKRIWMKDNLALIQEEPCCPPHLSA